MRDEFPVSVRNELAKRVGFLCSNPACRRSTSGPQRDLAGTVNIGVAAHITAASPRGPRYDSAMTSTERTAAGNGVWLCQTCGKLVDNDQSRYTVERLRQWKADAETAAARALERRLAPESESEGTFLEAERLMPDLIAEMRQDVRSDASRLIREFVILASPDCVFGGEKSRFAYYKSTHPDLLLQVDWLEEMGLVVDVTPGNAPVYRLVPEFAAWLAGSD